MAVSFDYLNTINAIQDPLLKDTFAWQAQELRHWKWQYQHNGEVVEALVVPINKNQLKVQLHDQEHLLDAHLDGNQLRIQTSQQNHQATIDNRTNCLTLYSDQGQIIIERFNWNQLDSQTTTHKGQLTAPMPATVVAILKNIGEKVKAGDRLIVLEAMKMEHTIHAPKDGVLSKIFYTVGAQVNEGEELLSLNEIDNE